MTKNTTFSAQEMNNLEVQYEIVGEVSDLDEAISIINSLEDQISNLTEKLNSEIDNNEILKNEILELEMKLEIL